MNQLTTHVDIGAIAPVLLYTMVVRNGSSATVVFRASRGARHLFGDPVLSHAKVRFPDMGAPPGLVVERALIT